MMTTAKKQFSEMKKNFPGEDFDALRDYSTKVKEFRQHCETLVTNSRGLFQKGDDLLKKTRNILIPDESKWMKWSSQQLMS